MVVCDYIVILVICLVVKAFICIAPPEAVNKKHFLLFQKNVQESSSLKSMSIHVPAIARSGESVTLSCQYDLEQVPLYSIKWYWNDEEFYRYVPKESPPFRAFTIDHFSVDISKSGPNEVTLRGVRREISGDYKCEVSSDGPRFHTVIKVSHMLVVELPNEDIILNVEPSKVEVGKQIVAQCYSPASEPPANITWFINGEEVSEDTEDVDVGATQAELDPTANLRSARSRLAVLTNRSHFVIGVLTVQCRASIYDVWERTAERMVRADAPHLAPALGSTSSQSQMDPVVEIVGNGAGVAEAAATSQLFVSPLCVLIITLTR